MVIKGGLDPEYVLDKMERYEVETYINMLSRKNEDVLDLLRTSCICSLQPYSKTTIKPTDIVVFPWEKEKYEETEKVSADNSKENLERIKNKMKNLTDKISERKVKASSFNNEELITNKKWH